MNRRGMALVLAVALVGALLPAVVLLGQIARSHLQCALDDYHRARAGYAARGIATMVAEDLEAGGDGRWSWPDHQVEVTVSVLAAGGNWEIEVEVTSGRATVAEIKRIDKQ